MAVPKRKVSKQRKHKRAANWKLVTPTLVECPQCHELKLAHHVCKNCGTYNGKTVIEKRKRNKAQLSRKSGGPSPELPGVTQYLIFLTNSPQVSFLSL